MLHLLRDPVPSPVYRYVPSYLSESPTSFCDNCLFNDINERVLLSRNACAITKDFYGGNVNYHGKRNSKSILLKVLYQRVPKKEFCVCQRVLCQRVSVKCCIINSLLSIKQAVNTKQVIGSNVSEAKI